MRAVDNVAKQFGSTGRSLQEEVLEDCSTV